MQTSDQINSPALILASGSPRRRELLERFWNSRIPQILIPDFDESAAIEQYRLSEGEGKPCHHHAEVLARILSSGKLTALQNQYHLPENYIALAADTLVVLDDEILGKPKDSADAARMLRLLSGRSHVVMTGVCLLTAIGSKSKLYQAVEKTKVRFAELSENQINWYIETGEPLDKAGAYGIQGFGAALIEGIEGCYYNVMGLPVHRLMVMLQKAADHFSSNMASSDFLPWS